jgi:protein-serine/threonine kinase
MRAPFVPNLVSITDTSYFDVMDTADDDEGPIGPETMDIVRNPNNDLAFLGYTYKRWDGFRLD